MLLKDVYCCKIIIMKIVRRAGAQWWGSGKDGKGTVSTTSKVLDETPFNFSMRFEEQPGTNPEELIGAALAACFSMKLSFVLNERGFVAEHINSHAVVTFEEGKISDILLKAKVTVPGMSQENFIDAAEDAKENCPISKSLNATIRLEAELKG